MVGRQAPTLRIPYAVAYAAGVVSTAWARLTGKEPRAPLDGVRMARKKMWVRHDKAARELGYATRAAEAALDERWSGFGPMATAEELVLVAAERREFDGILRRSGGQHSSTGRRKFAGDGSGRETAGCWSPTVRDRELVVAGS